MSGERSLPLLLEEGVVNGKIWVEILLIAICYQQCGHGGDSNVEIVGFLIYILQLQLQLHLHLCL